MYFLILKKHITGWQSSFLFLAITHHQFTINLPFDSPTPSQGESSEKFRRGGFSQKEGERGRQQGQRKHKILQYAIVIGSTFIIIVVAQNLEKKKRWSAHDGMRESRESIKLELGS
jgi:hypothetical protein